MKNDFYIIIIFKYEVCGIYICLYIVSKVVFYIYIFLFYWKFLNINYLCILDRFIFKKKYRNYFFKSI